MLMNALKIEHFRIEKGLITRNSGTCVKNNGDGSIATFENPQDALKFSSELQAIAAKHPGLALDTFELKIGIAHGEVHVTSEPPEISGNAANLASRILGQAVAGEVKLDTQATTALNSQCGPQFVSKYFIDEGQKKLHEGEAEQNIWRFDWKNYLSDNKLIAVMIKDLLEHAHLTVFNIYEVPLDKPGIIFWPVVLRDLNSIHKAQLETIKLLSYCDWTTYLFIADSDQVFDNNPPRTDEFENSIRAYAKEIGVVLDSNQIGYMSKTFDTASPEFNGVSTKFKELSQKIRVKDLFGYEEKSYKDGSNLVKERTVLQFLRTIFTMVAFQNFIDANNNKSIMVIAGGDELRKWDTYTKITKQFNRINVVCIPELKKGEFLIQQDNYAPIWRAKTDFIQAANETNLMQWAYDLFVCLPDFPDPKKTICEKYCSVKDCEKAIDKCGEHANLAERVANTVRNKFGF